jgi:hypothetical protein
MTEEQLVTISARATAFTVVCDRCAAEPDNTAAGEPDWAGASFAGSLDLDLDRGAFLCRRGHTVRVVRLRPATRTSSSFAA